MLSPETKLVGWDEGVALQIFIEFRSNEGLQFLAWDRCHAQGSIVKGYITDFFQRRGSFPSLRIFGKSLSKDKRAQERRIWEPVGEFHQALPRWKDQDFLVGLQPAQLVRRCRSMCQGSTEMGQDRAEFGMCRRRRMPGRMILPWQNHSPRKKVSSIHQNWQKVMKRKDTWYLGHSRTDRPTLNILIFQKKKYETWSMG